MKLRFRFRFGLMTLLAALTVCALGFAFWHNTIRYYQQCRDQENLVLAGLDEHFGDVPASKMPRRGGYKWSRGDPSVVVLLKSRTEQRIPSWITATNAPFPSEWFQRITHVTVHETKCLQQPSFSLGETIGTPPEFVPADWICRLNTIHDLGVRKTIDWPTEIARMSAVRRFYVELSKLTDLAYLRPGPLFGDDELALFQQSRTLVLLDLSMELPVRPFWARFSSCVTDSGLRKIKDGFPSLKFLILEDYGAHNFGDHLPSNRYSLELVAELRQARPDLTIVHYRVEPSELRSEARVISEITPSLQSTVDAINQVAPDLDFPAKPEVVARIFHPEKKPSREALAAMRYDPAIASLDFRDTQLDDALLDELPLIPGLRYLGIARTQVTLDGLRRLTACKQLNCLYVSDSLVDHDVAIETLRLFPELKVLLLDGAYLDDSRIESIRRVLPHLTIHQRTRVNLPAEIKMRFEFARRVPPWAKTLAPKDLLEAFDVVDEIAIRPQPAPITALQLIVERFPGISKLSIFQITLSEDELILIRSLTSLRELWFVRLDSLTDVGIERLFRDGGIPTLEAIEIHFCPVSSVTLHRLLAQSSLKRIALRATRCKPEDLPPSQSTAARSIYISSTE